MFCVLCGLFLLAPGCGPSSTPPPGKSHIILAAHDTPEGDKKLADAVCTADNAQDTINAAIANLPATGGQVTLLPGNYTLRKAALIHKNKPVSGAILINKNNVFLQGYGPSTSLFLADAQDCNVVRITGVKGVTVERLSIDANFQGQTVRNRAFESCGIRASWIHEADGEHCSDIVVRECTVRNAAGLGIMLWGSNVQAVANVLSDNQADDIELLGGPGIIRGNSVTRTSGNVDSVLGTDAADDILITQNTVTITGKGSASVGIRSWGGFSHHIITNNIVRVEKGGALRIGIDSRTTETIVNGNLLECPPETPCIVSLGDGNIVTGNIFRNAAIGYQTSPLWKDQPHENSAPEDARGVVFDNNTLLSCTLDAMSFQNHCVPLHPSVANRVEAARP
ncbi:right-handed parallel beta-helix repeat-containing protein [Fundidesulfovibrio magnetotacticus]|nr:right-handed parallel beta-helix repeat-containing protein [Fundidesulfovibrio magnetotacticus]